MGYDLTRFQGDVDEELICAICSGVLEDPVQAPVCEHPFCSACINEWLSRNANGTCPVDRQPVSSSQLKPAQRILRNLLARLKIDCDNAALGCEAIVKLDLLTSHCLECDFNPKKPVPCEIGCGLTIPKDELKEHNCIKSLREVIKSYDTRYTALEQKYTELRREVNSVKDCVRAMRAANPSGIPAMVETMEHDDVERWAQQQPRARVTRWGGMISTPDTSLQESVRKALIDSQCPLHVVNELMENSHERRWPPGLSTLEIRQLNRRVYDSYLCRKIQGRQAVVVMSCDNAHISDDMVLEPGLVMIFAHGIE